MIFLASVCIRVCLFLALMEFIMYFKDLKAASNNQKTDTFSVVILVAIVIHKILFQFLLCKYLQMENILIELSLSKVKLSSEI